MIQLKRAYEQTAPTDGYRVLVDRLWPRGETKEKLALDLWLKDIGPSNELRKWFNHVPEKFPEFTEKYIQELQSGAENAALVRLQTIVKQQPVVTLVYGAKDTEHNNAVVLKEVLKSMS